jgi:signal transduction histidine kinase
LPHVCAPFYQADASSSRAYGGTGLGLAICSKLMKLHGGSLEIASQKGQGTTISVRFPKERVVPRVLMRRELT